MAADQAKSFWSKEGVVTKSTSKEGQMSDGKHEDTFVMLSNIIKY